MSRHAAFRRQPVDQQVAQNLRTMTIPAPSRGIIQNENESFMQPGGCNVCDNWAPTMRGVKLRGGSTLHCDINSLTNPAWANSTHYTPFDIPRRRYDSTDGSSWDCAVDHTSAASGTFAEDRALHPTYWIPAPVATLLRRPIISAFEYVSSGIQRMYAANEFNLYDVTSPTPVLIKANQTSGNYVASQLGNAAANSLGTNWMLVCNEAGDPVLRFNGTTWVVLDPLAIGAPGWVNNTPYAIGSIVVDGVDATFWKSLVAHTSEPAGTFAADRAAHAGRWSSGAATDGASYITGPIDSRVQHGRNLSYVWKYRNRYFFIESSSMTAWFLPLNAVGGALQPIPMAGAASLGGHLMFGASWSLDAGDGIDEKCIFVTSLGEVLIYTGTNPADPANWRQQGRYRLSTPMGMNAHLQVGGDMMIMTVDGIIPLSQAISKGAGQLELAMLTRTIKPLWRAEVSAKRTAPWSVEKWDEYGAIFVAVPGGDPGEQHCLLANNATGAWARFLGWDATCFIRLRNDLFFGTQQGAIMQADRTGFDTIWDTFDGRFEKRAYVATLVGGWEMFGATANQVVWHQARASFKSAAGEPFQPQLAATVDYLLTIPPPPPPGPDPGRQDVWDQGLWGIDAPWLNAHNYAAGDEVFQMDDIQVGTIWRCVIPHTSAASGTFQGDRAGAAANKWVLSTPASATDIALYAQWDQPAISIFPVRNTLWVSIGQTGYAHAPIVQVTIAQGVAPSVELIAISTTYEPAGVNV